MLLEELPAAGAFPCPRMLAGKFQRALAVDVFRLGALFFFFMPFFSRGRGDAVFPFLGAFAVEFRVVGGCADLFFIGLFLVLCLPKLAGL